jgi:hypothetical protein
MNPLPETFGSKVTMALFCYALFTIRFAQAQCIASGPNSPAASSSVSFAGSDYSFNNPTNSLTSDNSRSIAQSLVFNGQTEYLQATDFGFAIPAASTICGIEVSIEKNSSIFLLNTAYITDNRVRIIKNGTVMPTDLAQTNVVWSTGDANSIYGDNNEIWGTTWSPSDINSADFGVAISAEIVGSIGLLPAARIDHISITVYYLDPSVLATPAIQFNVANGSNNSALLSWKPGPVDETTFFSVERSENGTQWEPVNGSPEKSSLASLYTLSDAEPLPGRSFYRLKMMAVSGAVRYTMIQPFESGGTASLKCYPNPFTSRIQVTGIMPGERVTLSNLFGQQLYLSPPAVINSIKIDINDLQPGIYVITAGNRKMKVLKK